MSFNHYARKVRNTRLALAMRYSALRSCVQHLSGPEGPTNGGYHVACSRLASLFGFLNNVPTDTQLLDALAFLEVSRNRYLERLRTFEKKRIREKMQGKRHPNRADLLAMKDTNQR